MRRLIVVLVLSLSVAACSNGGSGGLVGQAPLVPTDAPVATFAPLATEAPSFAATAKPAKTAKPTATKKPSTSTGYYKPPGWDGHSDVDCKDFDTHAHAESFFKGTGGTTSNDPYRLDNNHDGVACESLP